MICYMICYLICYLICYMILFLMVFFFVDVLSSIILWDVETRVRGCGDSDSGSRGITTQATCKERCSRRKCERGLKSNSNNCETA